MSDEELKHQNGSQELPTVSRGQAEQDCSGTIQVRQTMVTRSVYHMSFPSLYNAVRNRQYSLQHIRVLSRIQSHNWGKNP